MINFYIKGLIRVKRLDYIEIEHFFPDFNFRTLFFGSLDNFEILGKYHYVNPNQPQARI